MPNVQTIAEARTASGETIKLTREGIRWFVRVGGKTLMSSETHGSEEGLAELTCARLRERPGARVLVGGLGMGFTLRAVLDIVGPDATVEVAELIPAVVDWNRGPIAALAARPLEDPRVVVRETDIIELLAEGSAYDAIALDVDNGPEAFTVPSNDALYGAQGLERMRSALRPGGLLGVWSAFRDRRFERRMKDAGLVARTVSLRARGKVKKGAAHYVFVGQVPGTN